MTPEVEVTLEFATVVLEVVLTLSLLRSGFSGPSVFCLNLAKTGSIGVPLVVWFVESWNSELVCF